MRIPSPVLAGNKSWGEGLLRAPYRREPSSSDPTCHQVPLPEEIQVSPGDTEIHRVEPEDVANHLTAFHWELFRCVHEVGLRLVLDGGGGGVGGTGRAADSPSPSLEGSLAAHTWAVHKYNLCRPLSLIRENSREPLQQPVSGAAHIDSELEFLSGVIKMFAVELRV